MKKPPLFMDWADRVQARPSGLARRRSNRAGQLGVSILTFILVAALQTASAIDPSSTNKTASADMAIEDIRALMNIPVHIQREERPLNESAAAISVLTQDDIHRSGAMSVPEALRLVPGLDVAQVDSQRWAISSRGFNELFADKLLVMQDGRSLYSPLFSGVFWDAQNPLMEDIDRIEVIRGPGGSLWGENAVNGVINIVTKSAKDTQDLYATAGGGGFERAFAAIRDGGKLGEDLYFRVYGEYSDHSDSELVNGTPAHDAWQSGQGGFRMDWDKRDNGGDLMTFQGDLYTASLDQVFNTFVASRGSVLLPFGNPIGAGPMPDDERTDGGNLLGRWTHSFSSSSDLQVQAYFDRTERETIIFGDYLNTYDIDVQHRFALGGRNDIVWGGGYRVYDDRMQNTPTISFNPEHQTTELFSAFVQDEITLVEDRLRLTLGAKIEHNDYTGFDFQPNGRLLWTPTERQSFWGAVSRAVRTPAEVEENAIINNVLKPGPGGVDAQLEGNPNFESEVVNAFELGYRVQLWTNVSLDLATYYNVYQHLRSEEQGTPTISGFNEYIPVTFGNELHGDAYGVEVAPTWQVADFWRLRPAYTLLKLHVGDESGGADTTSAAMMEGESPQQQFSLRSSWDLPYNVTFDVTVRYVDRLTYFGINSYVAGDARLAWRPSKNWEIALVGQNIGNAHHAEFAPTFIGTQRTEVGESGYARITWRF